MRNVKMAGALGTLTMMLVLGLAVVAQAWSGNSGTMAGETTGTTMMSGGTTGTTMMGAGGRVGGMFSDTAGEWYQDMAERMAEAGFMQGYADGRFGGMDEINRAQFAAVMARMLGISPVGTSGFSDMRGMWAEGAVAAMAKAGIIMGHPDGTFGPYDSVTRAQMAAMMDRARESLGLSSPDMSADEFDQRLDDVAGHWAAESIRHMYSLGVVQGDTAGSFHPDSHTNRAQAAAMLWRWHEAR